MSLDEAKLLGREGVRCGLLVKFVEFGTQDEERGEPMHHLAEMILLGEGQRSAGGSFFVSVAKPLLEDRVTAKLEAPDGIGHIAEEATASGSGWIEATRRQP